MSTDRAATTTDRLIDVSHEIEHGMVIDNGLPAPIICDFLSRGASRARYASGIDVDAPFHRYAGGKDFAELPLDSLAELDLLVLRFATNASRAFAKVG